MRFKDKLKYLRRKKGWTIGQLSKAAGLSEAIISKYENGHIIPGVLSLQKLTDALGIDFDDLKDVEP